MQTNMFLGSAVLALLAGCTSAINIAEKNPVKRTPAGGIDSNKLQRDYAAELAHRPAGSAQPTLGLALSGGGTKAAMFAHGILHGLQDQGILESVDAISTVSGGGYAGYWYFSKLIEADRSEGTNTPFTIAMVFQDCVPRYWVNQKQDGTIKHASQKKQRDDESAKEYSSRLATEALQEKAMDRAVNQGRTTNRKRSACPDKYPFTDGDPYRWQAHLMRWPDIFDTTIAAPPDGAQQGRPTKDVRRGLLAAFLIEPVSQFFSGKNGVPERYQFGIERAWGLNPEPRMPVTAETDKFEQWTYTNGIYRHEKIQRSDTSRATWAQLRDLHMKTAAQGRRMPLWIVNSNSHGKSSNPKKNTDHIFEMTPFGYGGELYGYIDNPEHFVIPDLATSMRSSASFADAQGIPNKWLARTVNAVADSVPGFRWGVPIQVYDRENKLHAIRLSDGGGTDNLGLYSLLKRGYTHIIVADSASDSDGEMEDLCHIQAALQADQIDLVFAHLDLGEICKAGSKRRVNVSEWKNPILKGTAIWRNSPDLPRRMSTVWLVKPAWDQAKVDRAFQNGECGNPGEVDCLLAVYYGSNTSVKIDPDCPEMIFPQHDTPRTTLNSSSYLIWAYRELGRSIARHFSYDKASGTLTSSHPEVTQPIGFAHSKCRPTAMAN